MNYKIEDIHINNLKQGDTIIHNGVISTVTGKDLKYSSFMGRTVFGDSYHCGHKPVKKVIFK